MKYCKNILLRVIFAGICVSLLAVISTACHTEEYKPTNKPVVIELDYIPLGIKPGDIPITLNLDLLKKLLPELENPRLMKFEDLGDDDEKSGFVAGGYKFILGGDFNNDGFADLAFVGKYYNKEDPESDTFLAIVSFRGKKVARELFWRLPIFRASLKKVLEFKPNIDGILIAYAMGTDYCEIAYWTGSKFQSVSCQSAKSNKRG